LDVELEEPLEPVVDPFVSEPFFLPLLFFPFRPFVVPEVSSPPVAPVELLPALPLWLPDVAEPEPERLLPLWPAAPEPAPAPVDPD